MTMTFKYKEFITGKEIVFHCERVVAHRHNPNDKHAYEIAAFKPDGGVEHFVHGTAWLMNDSGATVSQWFLEENLKPNGQPYKKDGN